MITSLARRRIVVVQGATNARLSRGIAASRDSTMTGRLPASASSHHHTSPRSGNPIMRQRQLAGMTPDRPTRRAHRLDAPHRRRSWHPPRPIVDEPATLQGPDRSGRHRLCRSVSREHWQEAVRRPLCSIVCDSCHKYAIDGAVGCFYCGPVRYLESLASLSPAGRHLGDLSAQTIA
jgi:hypothetical protein